MHQGKQRFTCRETAARVTKLRIPRILESRQDNVQTNNCPKRLAHRKLQTSTKTSRGISDHPTTDICIILYHISAVQKARCLPSSPVVGEALSLVASWHLSISRARLGQAAKHPPGLLPGQHVHGCQLLALDLLPSLKAVAANFGL